MEQRISTAKYPSPVGMLTVACDAEAIVGLWIENQKYYGATIEKLPTEKGDTVLLRQARQWLHAYFQGKAPAIGELPLKPYGSPFRQKVWQILCSIPYGQTITYGEIAAQIAGSGKLASQAVGGAVGHNPISIIIPCHRVLGAGGQLTGYAGGVDKKLWLLRHEGVEI